MDAVKFLKERERMEKCSWELYKKDNLPPEELVALVEKWSKENPVRTRLTELLEKYPNAQLAANGIPRVCAKRLGYCSDCPKTYGAATPCRQCWETPLKENKDV